MNRGDLDLAARYHEECIEVYRESDNQSGLARALGNLALVLAEQGDVARAASLATESLDLFIQQEDEEAIAATLEILALVAHAIGDLKMAVRFHAAADALLARLELPLQMVLSTRHETSVARLCEQLGPGIQQHWESGCALALSELRSEASTLAEQLARSGRHDASGSTS
jgi:hypothetical protein